MDILWWPYCAAFVIFVQILFLTWLPFLTVTFVVEQILQRKITSGEASSTRAKTKSCVKSAQTSSTKHSQTRRLCMTGKSATHLLVSESVCKGLLASAKEADRFQGS